MLGLPKNCFLAVFLVRFGLVPDLPIFAGGCLVRGYFFGPMSRPVTWRTQEEKITEDRATAHKDPAVRDKVKPDKEDGAKAIFREPKHEPIPM